MNKGMRVGLMRKCGTITGYRDHGCRCDACREVSCRASVTARQRRYRQRVLVAGVLIHEDAPHGSLSGYIYWGCRCQQCTEAARVYQRGRPKPIRQPRHGGRIEHGTLCRYQKGCRCQPCRIAKRDAQRVNRAQRHGERIKVNGRLVHPRAKHGTSSGYNYYGCRCRPCTRSNWKAVDRSRRNPPVAA